MLLCCMSVLCRLSFGQSNCSLSGTVVDENNNALIGAVVQVQSYNKGVITNDKGQYTITGLNKGVYVVNYSFIGFSSISDTIGVNGETVYDVQLQSSTQNLQEVVVQDNYAEDLKKEETLNIEVVDDKYLKQNLGGSLMQSLGRLPGVSTIEIGSGQSKPVIRGLSFNRVVVVENGIKHEAQQWGTDHGLEIDQYAVDDVEIIKGPASLMYGSDAIGGVVKLNDRKVPIKNTFGGTVDLTGKTNNDLLGTSINLYGRKNAFFAEFRATILDYGDYKVPTDSIDIYSYRAGLYKHHLRNTAGKEQDLHFSFGIIQPKYQSRFYISNVHSKSGFFANAHGLEPRSVDTVLHDKSSRDINDPYQTVNHLKITNSTRIACGDGELELKLGYQHNYRQEYNEYVGGHGHMPAIYPDSIDIPSNLERQFDKQIYSGNLKYSHQFNSRTKLFGGINSEYQENEIYGYDFIFPAFKQLHTGAFAIGKYRISEKQNLQLGIRYDIGFVRTYEYYDWFPSLVANGNDTTYVYEQRAENLNRHFSNVSWSIGYNYNGDMWLCKINIGKSFRMPTAKELGSNGINYHYYRVEIGDKNLSPEESYQVDAGIEYKTENLALGTSPFINYFTNYIFLNPTSRHADASQKCYYTESEVFRFGGEIHAHYQLLRSLRLGILGEYVYSEQKSGEKKGYTLPFSPPASIILNATYRKQQFGIMQNAYCSIDYRLTAKQNKIVPTEVKTDGYQVVNMNMGGDVRVNKQKINISFQINNLLNTKYYNHTSFYRLINVPEAGRNFILNVTIPFEGQF